MATKFITVSIEIMHDTKLNQSQKFILAEIEQLSQLDNGCYASNKHFSDLIGITKENVSRNINELKSMGYIDIQIEAGSRNHTRIITLTTLVRPPYQNSKTPLLKQQETKENIHNNKTININPLLSAYVEVDANITENGKNEILEFIEYRKKIKKPIRTISPIKAYVKVIRELVKDGYKLEAIKDLMQQKEWQNIEVDWVRKSIKKDEEERYEW